MDNEHNKKQTILVTGCAGFIASRISELLLERGDTACLCDARRQVVGVDNLNDAYPPPLKEWRLAHASPKDCRFRFMEMALKKETLLTSTTSPAVRLLHLNHLDLKSSTSALTAQ